MSKNKKQIESKEDLPLNVTGKFYSVVKVDRLLYVGVEIETYKGVVIGVKMLQKAGDLATGAVGHCSREIWKTLKEHKIEDVLPDEVRP